jgi:nucleotide-binding universal stress UspA family protein
MSLDEWQREKTQARLKELVGQFPAAAAPVTELRSGDPDDELVHVAIDEGADLLVVGSHEHRGIERFLLGSTSEKVLRHAPCSVLVVKPRSAQTAGSV